ncbi:hypothetical protein [Salinibacterium sp. ZJ454]|uniref:hypothetical protein n=1 Tax=Salinibacterium sp. ZJ454 TaxID=2708339 RepID=UPI001422663C|nr:hypothetical protein [Salinibacterium sp. ZJ454]
MQHDDEIDEQASGEYWSAAIGPFYEEAKLGINHETLRAMVARREILALPIEGVLIYPSQQFVDAELPPRLSELLDSIDPDNERPWETALWVLTPNVLSEGRTPAQILRDGDDDAISELFLESRRAYESVTGP